MPCAGKGYTADAKEVGLEADKLNKEGRVMKKKDNAEPLKQTEKIDKIWEKISDLNPY